MKPIAPNTLIQNRYLIVHLIGKGGMGEVYLAVDQRLGSAIALKRTFFSDDATLGNAFEREARTLARLRHPVLPKVSDHFTEEGTQYLVMEHISGEDISKRLEGMDKPFPLSWVLFWADQLLDALTYLHTHEPPIIHRDIKPQNLKLTDENHIVLLDFGLSKNTMGETRATTTGSIVGYTPHYAPMEQIRGTGTDARSDLYSLSATLYQILTNAVPPDALTRADSLINGMPDPIQPISDLNTEVSRAVSDVIVKGMSISQEQRYKTAREMQKCLRDAFAQLQTDLSSNNIAVVPESQPKISQSQQKTEVIPFISGTSRVPQESVAETKNSEVFAVQTDSSLMVSKTSNGTEPDFDATMRYDEDLKNPPNPKQSNIQTEVLLAGSSDAITAAQKGHFDKIDSSPKTGNFNKSENYSLDESFTGNGKFEPAENYSPDATVPLFTFDNDLTGGAQSSNTAAFTSRVGENENKSSTGATFVPAVDTAVNREDHSPTSVVAAKKPGKGLAIGGGLAALLFLAVIAAGIGWYMLRDTGGTTENTTPTPSPETTASVEPSVAPTLEVVNETNSSTNSEVTDVEANTSTNSDVVNSETNVSTNANVKVVTANPTRPPQTAPPTPVRVPTQPSRPTSQTGPVKPPAPTKPPTPVKPPKIIIVQ